jgi:hypothetical protein
MLIVFDSFHAVFKWNILGMVDYQWVEWNNCSGLFPVGCFASDPEEVLLGV